MVLEKTSRACFVFARKDPDGSGSFVKGKKGKFNFVEFSVSVGPVLFVFVLASTKTGFRRFLGNALIKYDIDRPPAYMTPPSSLDSTVLP